jgi:hypothetical protein
MVGQAVAVGEEEEEEEEEDDDDDTRGGSRGQGRYSST